MFESVNQLSTSNQMLFSVVIPSYNSELYLRDAIESVLRQDYTCFELIVVDDGSTDASRSLATDLTKYQSFSRVILQENGGVAKAMNRGIEAARGEWIVVMHSDDIMFPTRLSTLARSIADADEKIGIVTANVELIGERGDRLGAAGPDLPSNPFFLDAQNDDSVIGGLYHTALRKKVLEEVGGYAPDCRVNEDVELYNKILELGYGVLALPEVLMKYRIHSGAASDAKARELMVHWRFLKSQIRRRRAGEDVPTWDDFQRQRVERPWFIKLDEWRKDTAKIYYRRAAGALSGRQWVAVIIASAISLILQPRYILARWWDRRHSRRHGVC